MATRKTSVEIDEELLAATREVLSTRAEVLRSEARREEVRALSVMEGMDLAIVEVMAQAWH